jgi:hypothetical protein
MSSTDAQVANAGSSSAGKSKTQLEHETIANGGFRPQNNMMTVEPPKKEDLQHSYATVVANDANPSGWYGSMSTYMTDALSINFLKLPLAVPNLTLSV